MATTKKYYNGKWEVVGTTDASTVSIKSEKLLNEDQNESNVEKVLLDLKDEILTMKSNIAWLAAHGGGGSGGGGIGGGTITSNDKILVNGIESGVSEIVLDEKLDIRVQAENSALKWNLTIAAMPENGVYKTIKSVTGVTSAEVTKKELENNGITGTFKLSVTAFNPDTLVNKYWNGTIYIASASISTTDAQFDFTNYATSQIVYTCQVGSTGSYILYINDKVVKSQMFTELTGRIEVPLLDLERALGEPLSPGSMTLEAYLEMSDNSNVKSPTFRSQLVLTTADGPIITCSTLSTDSAKPTEVYINQGSTTIILMPYTVYFSTENSSYKYRIYTATSTKEDFASIQLTNSYNKLYPNGSFSLVESTYDKNITITFEIQDTITQRQYSQNFYIVTRRQQYDLLDNGKSNQLLLDFVAFNGQINNKDWVYTNDNLTDLKTNKSYQSTLSIKNINEYSQNINTAGRYLRLQNASYATIKPTNTNATSYYTWITNGAVSDNDSINQCAFTLSVCYKCDFHPDDDRTVVQFANLYSDSLTPQSGILIKDHILYIGNNTLVLQDNELLNISITYEFDQNVDSTYGNAFVYVDGVVEAVYKIRPKDIIPNNQMLYVAASQYNGEDMFFTDLNLYRISLYKTCLTPYEILFDYLNNCAYSNPINGQIDSSKIEDGLRRNFINIDDEGNRVSLLWNNSGYSNNKTDFSSNFTLEELIAYEGNTIKFKDTINSNSYNIPIPMMIIDVSGSSSWTWENFITPTSQAGQLEAVSGCPFQYFDQNQQNSSTINGTVTVSLQGTSTLADFVKNLNITFNDDSIFVPKRTWFPENQYTLKADIVDSSHSLNTSIGKFINEELGFKYNADGTLKDDGSWYPFSQTVKESFIQQKSNPDSAVQKYFPHATLKHGVEGFPIFLIMYFNGGKVATLGIYQFILGRNSARNLGYEVITNVSGVDNEILYPYYKESGVNITTKQNQGYWVEMVQNDSFSNSDNFQELTLEQFNQHKFTGAFWQRDENGLYYNTAAEVKYHNLGNSGVTDLNRLEPFQNFVQKVQQLPVTNRRQSESNSQNLVKSTFYNTTYPKYAYQRQGASTSWIAQSSNNVLANSGDEMAGIIEDLNLESISKYFVLAMFFGLIDNFQKNMPIKFYKNSSGEWENAILGIYDTDTACGGTNEGELTVAESVWLCPIANDDLQLKEVSTSNSDKVLKIIGNSNKLWYFDSNEINYAMWGGSNTGSIYTSQWYNFISKFIDSEGISKLEDLANLYIDKYFIPQTEGCGELLFNLTYFTKYLNKYKSSSGGEGVNQYSKLHGRRIYQIRKWLKNRVKFLDSMFTAMGSNHDAQQIKQNTVNITSGSKPQFNITTNYPMVLAVDSQGSMNRFVFCDQNVDTPIYWGSEDSISTPVAHTITYPESIQKLGNDVNTLTDISYQKISSGNVPYLTEFNVSGCKTLAEMNADGMNSFKFNGISELRTIDCSNTAKIGSGAFNYILNLTSGFNKLQNLNIYNSCVSSIQLPTNPNIPLISMNIVQSQLTELELESQNLLENIDITGCSKLSTIRINNCEKLTRLNLNNTQSALNTVTISSSTFEAISCVNNTSVKSITITNSNNLKEVKITGCTKLTSVTIVGNKLNVLNLQNCNNLEELIIVNGLPDTMSVFDLSNTKVTKLTNTSTEILDVSAVKSFTNYFSVAGNSSVKYIQFANVEGTPINLTKSFQSCTSLLRIYGNVAITNATNGSFNGCSVFSIHGSNLSTAKYNNTALVNGSGVVLHPTENAKFVTNDAVVFQTGNGVTNMSFKGTSLDSTFWGTNCTLFDIYYVLYNIGTITNLTHTFRSLKQRFGYTSSSTANKTIHKNTFIKCGNVTSIYGLFRDSVNTLVLLSPTHNGTGVTADDGLFSPLVKCTSMQTTFYSAANIYCDRFLFRRTSGNYQLTNISYFWPKLVLDNVHTFLSNSSVNTNLNSLNSNSIQYITSNLNTCGNIKEFFNNCPSINQINGFLHNTLYINFTTTGTLGIPRGVTNVQRIIYPQYATGELRLQNMFASPESVLDIYNSFIIQNTHNSIPKVTFKLSNQTFSGFTKLRHIWYYASGDFSGSITTLPFSGNGITKTIEGEEFPYNILEPCKSTIISAGGLFQNVENNDSIKNLQLPGSLFESTPNIQNVGRCFYNIGIEYSLNSEGFTNCTKLADVRYLFACDRDKANKCKGFIPHKLFYHGIKSPTSVTYKYLAKDYPVDPTVPTENESGEQVYPEIPSSDIKTMTVTYNLLNTNITQIEGCFQGFNSEAYENLNPTVEINPEYKPFNFYLVNNKWTSTVPDDYQYTYMWEFDGYNNLTDSQISSQISGVTSRNIKVLDDTHSTTVIPEIETYTDNIIIGTLKFICPPDLLRYCSESLSNINYLFRYAGLSGNSQVQHSSTKSGVNYATTGYGVTGRICPYMLKPIPNLTSMEQAFAECNQLSYYTNNNVSYVIPLTFFNYTSKLTNLKQTFQNLNFPKNISLDVFRSGANNKQVLNVEGIFMYMKVFGTSSSDRTTISEIFVNNKVNTLAYAFSANGINPTSASVNNNVKRDVYVTFNKIFGTIGNNLDTYVFDGYSNLTVTFTNPSLRTAHAYNNYRYTNGSYAF